MLKTLIVYINIPSDHFILPFLTGHAPPALRHKVGHPQLSSIHEYRYNAADHPSRPRLYSPSHKSYDRPGSNARTAVHEPSAVHFPDKLRRPELSQFSAESQIPLPHNVLDRQIRVILSESPSPDSVKFHPPSNAHNN